MNAKHRGPTFVAEIDQVRETARLRAGAAIHAARQAAQQGDQRAAKTLLDQAMHEVRGKKLEIDHAWGIKRVELTRIRNQNRNRGRTINAIAGRREIGRAVRGITRASREGGSMAIAQAEQEMGFACRQAKNAIDGYILELRQLKGGLAEFAPSRRVAPYASRRAPSSPANEERREYTSNTEAISPHSRPSEGRRHEQSAALLTDADRWDPVLPPRVTRPIEWHDSPAGQHFLAWEAVARATLSRSAMRSRTLWRKLDELWDAGEGDSQTIGAPASRSGSWFSQSDQSRLEAISRVTGTHWDAPPDSHRLPDPALPDIDIPRGTLLYRTIFPN